MKRTLCYLVRHGQTLWNLENRIQGHSDIPLNSTGLEQANHVGRHFAAKHLSGIFTSHLARSRQTAQAIVDGNGHGIEPTVDRALAEIHLGDWEGLTPVEVDRQFSGAYEQWKKKPSSVTIPNAEPLGAFRKRVSEAVYGILQQVPPGEYVIVSHGGAIAALLSDVLGADFDSLLRRMRLDNASISAVECSPGKRPHILWINATSHLPAELVAPDGWL